MQALLSSVMLLLACSCGKAEAKYWIAGLDLPPGVRIVSRAEKDGVLTVNFSTPEDWSAVKAFVSDSLSASGYRELTHEKETKDKIRAKHPDWDEARVQQKYEQIERIVDNVTGSVESQVIQYSKPNSGYMVMLMNTEGYAKIAEASAKAQGKTPPAVGKYSLTVFTQAAYDKMMKEFGDPDQDVK